MELSTYLYFDGQCREAFEHYQRVLGGRIAMLLPYADAPASQPVSPGTEGRIMHARLDIGGLVLKGSDTPAGRFRKPQGFSVALNVDTAAEAERIVAALAEGGTITMPMAETFFADRFAMLEDRFGTPWIIVAEKGQAAGAGKAGAAEGKGGTARPFVIARTFEAPRELVWKAVTEPERMRRWWGPKGVEIIASKMDLRPGGTYLYGMRMPDGKEMWGRMVYREIEPPRRLHFINAFSDSAGGLTRHPLAPTWPPELLSTFTFDETDGQTTLTVRWEPLDAKPEEQAAFNAGHASMTGGWTGTLDQLAAYLAAAQKG